MQTSGMKPLMLLEAKRTGAYFEQDTKVTVMLEYAGVANVSEFKKEHPMVLPKLTTKFNDMARKIRYSWNDRVQEKAKEVYTDVFDDDGQLIQPRAKEMRAGDMFRVSAANGSVASDPHGNANFILVMRHVYKTPARTESVTKFFTTYEISFVILCMRCLLAGVTLDRWGKEQAGCNDSTEVTQALSEELDRIAREVRGRRSLLMEAKDATP